MGDYLRATVSYTDGHGGSKSAQAETVSATPIDGTWSYETVVNPNTIVAGGGVTAAITFRATFQADEGDLTSLSVSITDAPALEIGNNADSDHAGFAYSEDLSETLTFSDFETLNPPSGAFCTVDTAAGSIICETSSSGVYFYARSTALSPSDPDATYTVTTAVSDEFTYTATVNGSIEMSDTPANSDFADVTVTVTLPTPAKPSGFSATAGDGQVTLSWTDPSDSSITRYQLQQDEGDWADITGSGATTTEHVVYGLTNGDEYSFAILAVNANGSGPASDTERATPIGGGRERGQCGVRHRCRQRQPDLLPIGD